MNKIFLISFLCFLFTSLSFSQGKVNPPKPIYPVPSASQMAWHEMEMNAFIHFGLNTFTDQEWGMGNDNPMLFNPGTVNTRQWVSVLKEAGFKGIILTCKHHDGFCLWPSKYTDYTIRNSPYKNGEGDIAKELSEACRGQNIKFGVYLSPWDRNCADYGTPLYPDYYRNQLRELFLSCRPVFEMWFDGANGGTGYYGGANENRRINGSTYYGWAKTIEIIKQIDPNVIFFSDAGPGARWCGNEEGKVNSNNWNMITPDTLYAGKPGTETLLGTGSEDGTHWIPAEADVSIRPGWFYHAHEDHLVKSPGKLFEIYLSSVGRGAVLLLNVPPDKNGVIHDNDIIALKGFREILSREFKSNIASKKQVTATSTRGNALEFGAMNVTDGDKETYWATDDDVTESNLEIDLGAKMLVRYVLIQEYIKLGQRISKFNIQVQGENKWEKVADGTTIGYKRIIRIDPVRTNKVRITFPESRACPVIANVEVY